MVDQRTEFEIALKDNIGLQLQAITKQLKELNRLAKDSGDVGSTSVTKLKESHQSLARASRVALNEFTAIGETIIGFGKSFFGIGGVIATLHQIGSSLNEFAKGRVQLTMFSKDTKFATQDIYTMRGAMARMGIEAGTANQYIASLSTKLQELRAFREGSPLFQEFEKMGDVGTKFAKKLLKDVDAGDYKKALTDILEVYKTQGPEVQFNMSQFLGVPQSVLENMQRYRAMVKNAFLGDPKAAQDYLNNLETFREKSNTEWTLIANHMLPVFNQLIDTINSMGGGEHGISNWVNSEFDAMVKAARNTKNEWQILKDWWDKIGNAITSEILGPDKATEEAMEKILRRARGLTKFDDTFKQLEEMQAQKENNKLLGEIDQLLKRYTGVGGGEAGETATGHGPLFRPGVGPRARGDGGGHAGEAPGSDTAAVPGKGQSSGMVHGHPAVGLGPYATSLKGEKLFEPVSGWMGGGVGGTSAKFGPHMHEGVDIMTKVGTPVYAIKDGVVVSAPHAGGGIDQVLTIKHPDGTYSRYLHQGFAGKINVGDTVKGGQEVGSSGYRNAPHTHFEMWTGKPGQSSLMNPKEIFGWDKAHPAVGGHPVSAGGGDLAEARKNIDNDSDKSAAKPNASIMFTFKNVPQGVKTSADADDFFNHVQINRSKATEDMTK